MISCYKDAWDYLVTVVNGVSEVCRTVDIEKLQELDLIDTLDDKLKLVIDYRLKYKEASLAELSEIISKETNDKITKSGLNHRFRKIKEIIHNIEKNNNK